ncbi:hypothetical protein J437_LFUL014623 [Ladona fulva]|uniref:Uncharacterized protein n=1 Tax=Ladona fulva TaxID=123851 RepID=A0A8K0P783_LADFU|nr:hypothetical protein J437_LFUL014623 [Ladona fulva]
MSASNKGSVEKKGSSKSQINKGTRRTYDMNFRIMVANEAERTNNLRASRKYGVSEVNIRLWRKDLRKYKNANSSRKSFSGPKKGRFNEVEQRSAGYEKSSITVMIAVTADGQKLRPYVILKRKTMPKEKLCPGIVFQVQEKGWMTEELVLNWLNVIWGKRPGSLRNSRSMLVLDAFRGHLTTGVKEKIEALNYDLVIIPGGMTSQQPSKRIQQLAIIGQSSIDTFRKNKKNPVSLLGEWIATAWQKIEPESIVKVFKKCCISNDLNGTEDDILWETGSVNESTDDTDVTSMSSHSENSSDSE